MANFQIASRWRELSGENDWDGLLHPLDLDLRRYIIHYGERAASVGDLFNNDKNSPGYRHSLYPKEEYFSGACLEKGNEFKYSVTHFFYAGSATVESAWFGFVAVTTDGGKAVLGRRDILIAWRGTITYSEWFNNAIFLQTSASELFGTDEATVHSGFLSLYTGTRSDSDNNKTSARHQVRDAVRELVNKYQDEEISITVTGFSLGAALATLNAMDIVANGYNKPTNNAEKSCMVTAFVFGGPRVGNDGLEKVFNGLVAQHPLHLLRIKNANDPVPGVPVGYYTHFGKKLKIKSNESDYLKWRKIGLVRSSNVPYPDNPDIVPQIPISDGNIQEEISSRGLFDPSGAADYVSAHNMDVYLHAVAGVQEEGIKFHLEVDHDIALVNKHLDRLKDKYKIPPHWWAGENRKKMVQFDNGHWGVIIPYNN